MASTGDVLDYAVKIKDDTTLFCFKINEKIDFTSLWNLFRVKAKITGIKNVVSDS